MRDILLLFSILSRKIEKKEKGLNEKAAHIFRANRTSHCEGNLTVLGEKWDNFPRFSMTMESQGINYPIVTQKLHQQRE